VTPPGCLAVNLSECGGVITASLGGDKRIVVAAWWAAGETGLAGLGLPRSPNYVNKTRPPFSKAYMSLAAGSNYENLNKVQFSNSMIPTSFSVDVDMPKRTITVTPQNNSRNVTDIEPSGPIADSASSVLGFMSLIDLTLYSSVMGTMPQRNIYNVQQQHANSTTAEENALQGVAESVQVPVDDYLLVITSA
jgi:hypothetical protein